MRLSLGTRSGTLRNTFSCSSGTSVGMADLASGTRSGTLRNTFADVLDFGPPP